MNFGRGGAVIWISGKELEEETGGDMIKIHVYIHEIQRINKNIF